ncbi:VWA domain-containing protein [Haliangium ochraceum]|uniref:von Willebrand factor type A n=1 Tax=Haliangium ochraceum (strain DSM 14365 / JCM 11303 / SMP-2) TaxID=502025 RepID=D0LHL0_HALO1|nr:VWA domain-containing protein [Haliangium ochraceum]ACY12872.1 von Willebrand factor type A [Haliangium ochraceum DSM 14365]
MPPSELHVIVCDGYDREVFARLLREKRSMGECRERLGRLLPHPEPLLCDLFSVLFKLNVVVRAAEELAAAVQIHHRLVTAVSQARDLAALRARTELRENECAALLPGLVERILTAMKRDFYIGPQELLEAAEVAHDEDTLAQREAEREHLRELPEDAFDDDERERLEGDLDGEIDALRERIDEARARQARVADKITSDLDDTIGRKVSVLPDQLEQGEDLRRSMGLGSGREGQVGAAERLELGERLMRSRKLKLLAKLVGAFREVAFEARRRRVVRTPQVMHEVGRGAHLDRLLPSELLGLPRHRGALHREFVRRLVEGELLEYELRGASSRGPMVVCVDGSGSMQGTKEIWAKAVALTLTEIARRERRRCLAIVFSSGHALFEVELLGAKGRSNVRAPMLDDNVLAFAEHFPGGGTDFEPPMRRALAAVSEGNYRRGDIVFITDGQAQVSENLIADITKARKKHRFRVRGILVDVADSDRGSLLRFCDEVREVTDLVADSLGDLFASV